LEGWGVKAGSGGDALPNLDRGSWDWVVLGISFGA
jgi:hypothetical protein